MQSDPLITRFLTIGNSNVTIGRFTYGIENISIKQFGEGASLKIGSFCSIASNITLFLGGNHRVDWITTFPFGHIFTEQLGGTDIKGHPSTNGNINIGNDVWIGHNATIMSGITIGDGAVIAANSHVVKDVAPYSIVGGNPAQHIKNRFKTEICDLLLQLCWWDLPLNNLKSIIPVLSDKPDIDSLNKLLLQFKTNNNVCEY